MRPRHVLAAFAALVVLASCGAREPALAESLAALNAARDGFVAYDRGHQAEIAASAPSLEQGTAALKAYREKREPVILAFQVAYSALALAAIEPSVANVARAASAAGELLDLLRRLRAAT